MSATTRHGMVQTAAESFYDIDENTRKEKTPLQIKVTLLGLLLVGLAVGVVLAFTVYNEDIGISKWEFRDLAAFGGPLIAALAFIGGFRCLSWAWNASEHLESFCYPKHAGGREVRRLQYASLNEALPVLCGTSADPTTSEQAVPRRRTLNLGSYVRSGELTVGQLNRLDAFLATIPSNLKPSDPEWYQHAQEWYGIRPMFGNLERSFY